MPRRRAFTLIELLVVVTLLGIVAVTVSVRLAPATDRARLRAATLTIEQTLRLARHRAMTKRQPVWLVFQIQPAGCRIVTSPQSDPPWRLFDGITLAAATVRGRRRAERTTEHFSIRVAPNGACAPWALEMQAGHARRVISSDGVTARLAHYDHIGLYELERDKSAEGSLE